MLKQFLFQKPQAWRSLGRCAEGAGTLTPLFFSLDYWDIARAKVICSKCPVTRECLRDAELRSEPWGVWGGETFLDGKIRRNMNPVGRPREVTPPPVIEESPLPPDLVRA